MFRSKTLFVLGAGASHEAGLPTGEGLKGHIANKVDIRFTDGYRQDSGDHQIYWAFKQLAAKRLDQNTRVYQERAWLLRDALPQAISIDNLLDAHRDDEMVAECGKLAIVKSIQEAEQNSKLFFEQDNREKLNFNQLNGTWFSEFMKLLTEGVSKSELSNIFSNVSFISFNYDRCVEHYIYNAIKNYYAISDEEAKTAMKRLKVLHPYGQIGKLSWQEGYLPVHQFGADKIDLLSVFNQIKTFNERVHDGIEISEIRKTFEYAETIVFLGFAFHRQNIELLNPSSGCVAKRIYATAWEVSRSDCDVIKDELKSILNQLLIGEAKIEIRNDLKCVGLFREYWRGLTS